MTDLDATRDLLGQLIACPTVSSDSNLDMIDLLANRLEDMGGRVQVLASPDGRKANLFATFGPDAPGGIVLSGHTDVVPVTDQAWTSDPFEMVERDARLFGRGTCDMKGFIAAAVTKAAGLGALDLARPLHLAFTYDEEVGCLGAQALVEWLRTAGIRPSVALIGEPTNMAVIEGHKGCCEYVTRFHGLAGHGSAPDRGVNAVEYAARYVGRLMEMADVLRTRAPANSPFDPPWTTINTGVFSGGHAQNVIPENARVEWEFRPVQPDDFTFVKSGIEQYVADVLLPRMRAVYPGASVETEIVGEVAGLVPHTQNEARDICMELTGSNTADVVPFGTEAGIFAELGMTAAVCGPGSIDQAHKPDEYLELDQLQKCLTMLDRLVSRLVA